MASPSADPFAESNSGAPSQAAPAPAKRSLFKNRKPKVVKTAEEEAVEALDFFSRSKQVFPEAIREQRERRAREEKRKQEKEEERRKREEEDAERQLKEEQRAQQRLDALGREGSQDEFNKTRRRSRSYSETRSSPSPPRSASNDSLIQLDDDDGTTSPPHKRRSPRNQRTTRSQAQVEKPVISLSSDDDEDDDEDIKIAKQVSLYSEAGGAGYDAFTSSPPRTTQQRKRSPSIEEVLQEDEMFPELVAAARAQAAAEQAGKLKALQRRLGRTKSASSNGSGSPRDTTNLNSPAALPSSPLATRDTPKEDAIISIYVDSRVEGLSKPIIVKRKLSQRLKDVRMAWCDRQDITSHLSHRSMSDIEKEQIFLSWRGRRVWDVTTAESLGIRVERGRVVDERGEILGENGNLYLEAWTGEAWGEWMRERRAEKVRLASGTAYGQGERVDLEDDEEVTEEEVVEEEPVEVMEVERIKIILKPRVGEPVKLIVKPTTLVDTIVKGFIQQRGELCEGKGVELWFDGERLEEGSSVGDADVEDMSGIDVVLRDV